MAKLVVKYLLEGDGSVPTFIEDGGYFPVGEECVGISVDENKRHVPSTVIRLTLEDLALRITNLVNYESDYESEEEEAQAFFDRIS